MEKSQGKSNGENRENREIDYRSEGGRCGCHRVLFVYFLIVSGLDSGGLPMPSRGLP